MEIDSDNGGVNDASENKELDLNLSNLSSADEYFRSWLSLQSSHIKKTIQSILVIKDSETGDYLPVAKWPEGNKDSERLADLAERVLLERSAIVTKLSMPERERLSTGLRYGIAYPVLVGDDLRGVVALEVSAESDVEVESYMKELQWGVPLLELFYRRNQSEDDNGMLNRLTVAVDLLASVVAKEKFRDSTMTLVTELATYFKCDRVSYGVIYDRRIEVEAVSHSAKFTENMNIIRAIARAMDEAVMQRKVLIYPELEDPENKKELIMKDHEALEKQVGTESILTLPIYGNDKYCGALTLERPVNEPFKDEEVQICNSIISLVAPVLEDKRLNDRLLIQKIKESLKQQSERFFGEGYFGRKLAAGILAVIFMFLFFVKGEYRVSADTILEGEVRRIIAAPFNGYIKDSLARAGDVVKGDTVLATLDDKDLRLERLNLISRHSQLKRQEQEATAQHKRAKVKIIQAQIEQVKAEKELATLKIGRTNIVAPIDGLIVSGDLSHRLGGLVEKGELLFELSPLNAYRLILHVDERRIADIKEGQRGILLLASLPESKFGFEVKKITPVAAALDGINYFEVEASLDNISDNLRPGMEGVGKISVDKRPYIQILSRSLVDWLRLWVWSWWP